MSANAELVTIYWPKTVPMAFRFVALYVLLPFVTMFIGVLGEMRNMIVSVPDHGRFIFFVLPVPESMLVKKLPSLAFRPYI